MLLGYRFKSPDVGYTHLFPDGGNCMNQPYFPLHRFLGPVMILTFMSSSCSMKCQNEILYDFIGVEANLTISINGSLILLDGKQDVIWSTGEAFTSNKCHAELQDSGNLVVIDDVSGKTIWQSFENLGDTMLPHSSLMYDLSHGKKRVLTSWKSNSDPSPGSFSLEITPQVPLQGLMRRGSAPYWRTGPWAKTRFTGFPQFDETYVSPFSVVQDLATGTGSFSYSMLRNFNLSYLTLTPEGEMKIYWDQGKRWMHHLTEPEHPCDLYGTCGPFGMCVRSSKPKCICVKGFVPKSDEEWRKRNWTSGCVRRKQLSCQANSSLKTQAQDTDGFYRMTNPLPI